MSMDRKASAGLSHRALVSETEKVEHLQSTLASLCPAAFGVLAKLDQTGFLAMQLKTKFCESLVELFQTSLGLLDLLDLLLVKSLSSFDSANGTFRANPSWLPKRQRTTTDYILKTLAPKLENPRAADQRCHSTM